MSTASEGGPWGMAVLAAYAARPAPGLVPYVGEKHYQRKHGKNAYYGQGGR